MWFFIQGAASADRPSLRDLREVLDKNTELEELLEGKQMALQLADQECKQLRDELNYLRTHQVFINITYSF